MSDFDDSNGSDRSGGSYKSNSIPVFKKWRKSKASSGFISISYWPTDDIQRERCIVEIGETNPQTDKIVSVSTCYVPALQLLSYLHSEINDLLDHSYPTFLQTGRNHGLSFFGGKNISRVFKIEDWNFNVSAADDNFEISNKRRFKAAEFELKPGTTSSEPDYSKCNNRNSIQMKQEDLSIVYLNLNMAMQTVRNNRYGDF